MQFTGLEVTVSGDKHLCLGIPVECPCCLCAALDLIYDCSGCLRECLVWVGRGDGAGNQLT